MDNQFRRQVDQDIKNLSTVWTSDKIIKLLEDIESGIDIKSNPFWDGKPEWRAANIVFEYTAEEILEIEKCAKDIIYFANKYCFVMTDDGIRNIILRDYQEDILRDFQNNRFCVFLSPRQSGKTICTGIFLTHYLLFNTDKNLMILSNTGATTIEIVDKIKVILSNLPFFLKPGILVNNQMKMTFDNGCRLFGRNTTKTAAIGFTVHNLFCDEFGHVHPNFLEPFWRSVYPTLSSSKISRCIITSTPNGMNKFYDIYMAALQKKNEFYPIRVDWWQVPGRDEAWKQREIANLGSEEDFNQEFGNQFLSSSRLLLDSKSLKRMQASETEYKWLELTGLDDICANYDDLKWHPRFNIDEIDESDRFAFTIDTAGGGGGDYTVLHIYKLVPLPIEVIPVILNATDESDFFGLIQVGMFRSNRVGIEGLQPIVEVLLYDVFGEENVRVILEMDFKGNLLYERMSNHPKFYEDIFIHTKHSEAARRLSPGIKLNPKNKYEFCIEYKRLVRDCRVMPNEHHTYLEHGAFGLAKNGTFSSQMGHDDTVMPCINLVPFFTSEQYYSLVEDRYDQLDQRYKNAITARLESMTTEDKAHRQDFDSGFLKDLMS